MRSLDISIFEDIARNSIETPRSKLKIARIINSLGLTVRNIGIKISHIIQFKIFTCIYEVCLSATFDLHIIINNVIINKSGNPVKRIKL